MSHYMAQRKPGAIQVYLSKNLPNPALPVELEGYVTADNWAIRCNAIVKTCSSFNAPIFERIYFVFALLATVIAPFPLSSLIFRAIDKNADADPTTLTDAQLEQENWESRGIMLAMFFAMVMIFWVPLALWKIIPMIRVARLIDRWKKQDLLHPALDRFMPVWKVQTAGVFKSALMLSVTTPPTAQPTTFFPNAYLPPYINPPPSVNPGALGYMLNEKERFEYTDVKV